MTRKFLYVLDRIDSLSRAKYDALPKYIQDGVRKINDIRAMQNYIQTMAEVHGVNLRPKLVNASGRSDGPKEYNGSKNPRGRSKRKSLSR